MPILTNGSNNLMKKLERKPMKIMTAKIEEDKDGNAIVLIPDEMIKSLGWKENDEVDVEVKNGSIYVTKAHSEKN
jgi:antitoxin component of MazEF toxin-antitoxin module